MKTCWNDTEHDALRNLSPLAQLLYFRVFRRRMDYQTGIAGGEQFKITLSTITNECSYQPVTHSKRKPYIPTRDEVRAAIAELERPQDWGELGQVALMADAGSCVKNGYRKRLLLADTTADQDATRTPTETHTLSRDTTAGNYPSHQPFAPLILNDSARFYGATALVHPSLITGIQVNRNLVSDTGEFSPVLITPSDETLGERFTFAPSAQAAPAETPKPKPKKKADSSSSHGTRISVESLPDDWRDYCVKTRPDLKPDTVFESFRDYWLSAAGAKGRKADWTATWRNWVRREAFLGKNQFGTNSGRGGAKDVGTHNREVVARLVAAHDEKMRVIDGTCTHESPAPAATPPMSVWDKYPRRPAGGAK